MASFVFGLMLSPILGMAIGETRNLILGLAPEEAVLTLADEIDKNRENNLSQDEIIKNQELQISELENLTEQQKKELEDQKESFDQSQSEIKQSITNASEKAEACSRVFYYENQYKATDKNGRSFSYVKGENNVEKYYKIRGTIRDKYEDDEKYENIIDSIIKDIEADYQDYMRVKSICNE